MKSKLLILAAMLLTTNVFAQTASKIPSFELEGRTITDTTNLKVLLCINQTSANYGSCYDVNGPYTVPVGKQFRTIGFKLVRTGTAGSLWFSFGYGDVNVGRDSAAAPAGGAPVYMGGFAGGAQSVVNNWLGTLWGLANGPHKDEFLAEGFIVPTGKVPFGRCTGPTGCGAQVWGYEETP